MKPTGSHLSAPARSPQSDRYETDPENAELFDQRSVDPKSVSPASSANLLILAVQRVSTAFSEAAAWIRQLFFGLSGSPRRAGEIIVGEISRPRPKGTKSVRPAELEGSRAEAKNLHRSANTVAVAETKSIALTSHAPETRSGESENDRQSFETYVALSKADGKVPGKAWISSNFEQGTVAHAKAIITGVLGAKEKAEIEGGEFYLSSGEQTRLEIAIGVLDQQKGNPEALHMATRARTVGTVPTSTSEQVTSFMAWREWKNSPDSGSVAGEFSIDAALAYANELLATHAGKPQATQAPLKDWLIDATELIANADKFRAKYENAKTIADVLNSAKALADAPVSAGQTRSPGSDLSDLPSGRGAPPPPPPPRVRVSSSPGMNAQNGLPPAPPPPLVQGIRADTSPLSDTPLPTTPPPAAPAPRKQNLQYLVGSLPAWSARQLDIIASAAFPLGSDQIGRAMRGLRSIDWAAEPGSIAAGSGKAMDEIQRRMSYSRQQEAEIDARLENLEYASMLLKNLKPEQLKKYGPEFGPLSDMHALRRELSARIEAEMQALRPPRTSPANKRS